MEIESKTRVAAKAWPTLSGASSHSPCGQRAHHGPSLLPAREMGNGRNRASSPSVPVSTGHARLCPVPLLYEGWGHYQSTILFFWGDAAARVSSDNVCSSFSCTQDKRVLVLRVQRQPKMWWIQQLKDAKLQYVTKPSFLCGRSSWPHDEENRLTDLSWYPVPFNETTGWLQTRVGIPN